ncbi:hypothetical protein [Rhodococcus sp. WAY2]|uniref:hypothetical protein n=1 Tax=Rhodococcus sp. WAY2 TaxID=2663121 RepID=UPI00131FF52D|nr:hypothetical protein [Rhodococcus sp. WAY2]QHE72870.1 hypothetical protein GFS60_06519 [Rhodococcus sp. WAY2]
MPMDAVPDLRHCRWLRVAGGRYGPGREHETGSGLAVAAMILGTIELMAVVLAIVLAVSLR